MPTQGPRDPTTVTDDATVGTIPWGTPGNAVSSNDIHATASLNLENSHYLKATGFGFTIPTESVIAQIKVEYERKSTPSGVQDSNIRIVKGGVISATNVSDNSSWEATDTYKAYVGLFGETWTPADINATGFGFAVAVFTDDVYTANIDHMRITVTYEAPILVPQLDPDYARRALPFLMPARSAWSP